MDSAPITEQQLPLTQQKPQTLQDKHQNEEEFKAAQASRRSRKDIEGRDFICGCGKKYLSYPALYTHIKTKHDGKQPEGTMKYSTTVPPKKSKTKLQQQHLNYLISQLKRQDLPLIDLLLPRFIGSTPLSSRLKSKILEKSLTDTYHSLLKTTTGPLKLTKQSPLEQHLVAWLIGTGQYITQKLHEQYQWFARTLKECYYQMGGQVYNKCFSKKDGGLCYVPHFKVEKVKYLPLICDFYVRFFLVYEYPELNANLMELILTDFCHWLNRRKCTFIEIILNKEYKLTAPLKIEEDQKNDPERVGQEDQEKCDQSEFIQPESQKQDESKQGHKIQSNHENHHDKNPVEESSQKNEANHDNIIEEGQENNLSDIVVKQTTQKNPEAQTQPKPTVQNGHQNWSVQENPAAESSQSLSQQERQSLMNGDKAQSEAAEREPSQLNGNEHAQSEKL